ncbi:MAG: hypothetical protein HYZ26_08135 [Chloroflexi bacterium]|nr:hypothetical protein [Chloroflexota bacterium]
MIPDLRRLACLAAVTLAAAPAPLQFVFYETQPGDTLTALAARFDAAPAEIAVYLDPPGEWQPLTGKLPGPGLLPAGLRLRLPAPTGPAGPAERRLPDQEVIFSAAAADFNPQAYLDEQGGYLATFLERQVSGMPAPAAALIQQVGLENSINPRLLLALLETRCGCARGPLAEGANPVYLLGVQGWKLNGLYRQLVWLQSQLTAGYYGWRAGTLTEITLADGSTVRLAPTLNAGTVALQHTLAQWYGRGEWEAALADFTTLYAEMFGDPWARAEAAGPIFPPGLEQPALSLPWLPGHTWAYVGGPHSVWEKNGVEAAIDLNPGGLRNSCEPSEEWALAMADGVIARLGEGLLVLDLDGDGSEHTGWALLYLHLEIRPGLKVGQMVGQDDLLGHPACAGGPASSAHLHLARKYNGEWMPAGGPLPFTLGGWVVGDLPGTYKGTLTNGETVITACQCGTRATYIRRPRQP